MEPSELILTPLAKALQSLQRALKQPLNDIVRDATIQRFEFTFELSWKVLKRYFELNSRLSDYSLKNIFREAGKQKLISSVENWFGYLEARNLTSHTYNEQTADEVYQAAQKFAVDAAELIKKLEAVLGRS